MKTESLIENAWGILPSAFEPCEDLLSLSLAMNNGPAGGWWDEYCAELADEKFQAVFEKGTGSLVLAIEGILLRGATAEDEAFWGFYNTRRIEAAAALAAEDPRIKQLALLWDSPGGYCLGMNATLGALAALRAARPSMPLASLVQGMCCSMAYVFANAAGRIEAVEGSIVGSIGIMNVTTDYSKMFQQAGVERRLFADGIYKGMGTIGVPWKDSWYEAIEKGVMDLSVTVRAGITAVRPSLTEDDMQGQAWEAGEAPAGMVDAIADQLTAEAWLADFAARV